MNNQIITNNQLQVNSPSNQKKVEKILSNGDAVYVLYADGTWRKKEKK